MAVTQISDVIVPEVFNPYVVQRTAELTVLYMGGIISNSPELDALALAGGKTVNMPFWNDLTGDDEILSDSGSLTPAKIDSGQDVAALLMRGKAWQVNDLARALSGDDPMRGVAELVAEYWARRYQAVLISSLSGVFADNIANDSGDMVNDIASESISGQSALTRISVDSIIDGGGTMGDSETKITGLCVHSDVHRALRKQKAVDEVQATDGSLIIRTVDGKILMVDDSCPKVAGGTDGFKYTSYLFGEGAFGLGNGAAPVPTETDRDTLAGNDILITRNHFIVHPRGIKATGSAAGASPTNAELATAAFHDRVYDRKNVRLGSIVTNI
jgi:hypothetical protein